MPKYVKKGNMEMEEQLYLEPWKSVLGYSILHYCTQVSSQATKQLKVKSLRKLGNLRRMSSLGGEIT